MLRWLAIVLALFFGIPHASAQSAPDDASKKYEAAERYAKVFNFSDMVGAMINETVMNSPRDQQAGLGAYLRQRIDGKKIHDLAIASMIAVFTADELTALADFYGSETGRSIIAKMPRYMGLALPQIQAELARSANQFKQQH